MVLDLSQNTGSLIWTKLVQKLLPYQCIKVLGSSLDNEIFIQAQASPNLYKYDIEQNLLENFASLPENFQNNRFATYRDQLIIFGMNFSYTDKTLSINYHVIEKNRKRSDSSSGQDVLCGHNKNFSTLSYEKRIFVEKSFSDITLIVQEEKIPAHRVFLTKCQYFQNLFADDTVKEIPISDVSVENFKAILEFIYCDEITFNEESAFELIGLADRFYLPKLKEACENYISLKLRVENVLKVANTSKTVNSKKLEDDLIKFVIQNFEKLTGAINLKSLPPELFIKIIQKLKK